jgi:hypothetical protein
MLLCCHSSRREQSLGISVANSEVDEGNHTTFVIVPCCKAALFPSAETVEWLFSCFFANLILKFTEVM